MKLNPFSKGISPFQNLGYIGGLGRDLMKVQLMQRRFVYAVVVMAAILVLAGCRQSGETGATGNANISVTVEPDPPKVGQTTLVITLTDLDGVPIDHAAVAVQGDMTHAGMTPVLANSSDSENGVYRIPFNWSMGGDWVLTITVGLPNGRSVSDTFEFTVSE